MASLVDRYVSIVQRSLISKRRTIAVGVNITYCEKHILGRFESCLLHTNLRKNMSKGSKQRPTDKDKFNNGWDRIFGKKKEDKKDNKKS